MNTCKSSGQQTLDPDYVTLAINIMHISSGRASNVIPITGKSKGKGEGFNGYTNYIINLSTEN